MNEFKNDDTRMTCTVRRRKKLNLRQNLFEEEISDTIVEELLWDGKTKTLLERGDEGIILIKILGMMMMMMKMMMMIIIIRKVS